jgi:hypothetical protein
MSRVYPTDEQAIDTRQWWCGPAKRRARQLFLTRAGCGVPSAIFPGQVFGCQDVDDVRVTVFAHLAGLESVDTHNF